MNLATMKIPNRKQPLLSQNAGMLQRRKLDRGVSVRSESLIREPNKQPEVSTPSSALDSVKSVLKSTGRQLDSNVRSRFEDHFGRDFSHVRIHTGSESAASANSISATAYTVGNQIAFGANNYQPSSAAGRQLLAHELTHVLQQGNSRPDLNRLELAESNSSAEKNAEKVEAGFESNESASIPTQIGTNSCIQRKVVEPSLYLKQPAIENEPHPSKEELQGEFKPSWLDKAISLLTEYGDDVGELAFGLIPVVGDIYDVVTAIIGKTLISGEELDTFDRILSVGGLLPLVSGKLLRLGRAGIEKACKWLNIKPLLLLNRLLGRAREILLAFWLRVHPILQNKLRKKQRVKPEYEQVRVIKDKREIPGRTTRPKDQRTFDAHKAKFERFLDIIHYPGQKTSVPGGLPGARKHTRITGEKVGRRRQSDHKIKSKETLEGLKNLRKSVERSQVDIVQKEWLQIRIDRQIRLLEEGEGIIK